jgi:beta-glucosidase
VSISGDVLPDGTRENRSYYGVTSRIANEADLDAFERAVAAVGASGRDIPVVTVLKATNPTVPAEFEAASDAVLVGFGVSDAALVEVALGLHEPQGRLPMAFPASMDAVEAQLEDVGGDTEPYVDAAGNAYGIGFGLGYGGVVRG